MMSKALLKNIRLSPTKARLIAREIQGMNAELALASLEFTPNKAAKILYKVVASAVANGGYDAESVVIKSCRVDAGPVLRRMTPKARGRGAPIRKPTSHILVEIEQAKSPKKSAKTNESAKGEAKKGAAKATKKTAKGEKVAKSESEVK